MSFTTDFDLINNYFLKIQFIKWIKKEYVEHYHKLIKLEKIALKEFFFITPLVLIQIILFGFVIGIVAKIVL